MPVVDCIGVLLFIPAIEYVPITTCSKLLDLSLERAEKQESLGFVENVHHIPPRIIRFSSILYVTQ